MPAEDAEFAQFVSQATAVEPAAAPTEVVTPPVVETPPVETTVEEKAPAVEAKIEEKPEEKKEEEPAWKKLVAAEKAKREAKRANQQGDTVTKAKLAEVEAELAEWREFQRLRDSGDHLAAAEKAKLSYEKQTSQYVKSLDSNEKKPDPEVQGLSQKIQQLETAIKQQRDETSREAQVKAVQSFNAEVGKVLETKASDFELVSKHPQGVDLVREIVAAHYRETATFDQKGNLVAPGELMATEEACARAEGWLDDFLGNFKGTRKFVGEVKAKAEEPKVKKPDAPTISQDMRQGGTKQEPHGDEVEQLLLLKKTLESQLNASQGN